MIQFTLKCSDGHAFDSWFASGAAFDTLAAAGQLSCPECGSGKVEKALMAPKVRASSEPPSLKPGGTEKEKALTRLRDEIEKTSDYVGLGFAAEARAMHEGGKPQRSIYGEARLEDAKALVEDGVPVAPLPFMPRAKTN